MQSLAKNPLLHPVTSLSEGEDGGMTSPLFSGSRLSRAATTIPHVRRVESSTPFELCDRIYGFFVLLFMGKYHYKNSIP